MEDPNEEWEETTPPGESGRVGWVLRKGLGIGKKIVISGIVISSAPLVIPPLVIYSTIGFALSVPFGFYFSSYACTEKLMSTLLSTPTTHTLEYGIHYDEFCGDEGENFRVGEVVDYEKEVEMDTGGFDLEWKHIEEGQPVDDFSGITVKEVYEDPDEGLALEGIGEHLHDVTLLSTPTTTTHTLEYGIHYDDEFCGDEGEDSRVGEVVDYEKEVETDTGGFGQDWKHIEEGQPVDDFSGIAVKEVYEEPDKGLALEEIGEHLHDVTVQPLEEIDTKIEEQKGDDNVGGFEEKADFVIEQEPIEVNLLEEYMTPLREINITVEVDKDEGQIEPLAMSNPIDEMQMVANVMGRDEKSNTNAEVDEPFLMTAIVNEEIQDAAMATDISKEDLVDEKPLPDTDMKVEGEKEVITFSHDENETEPLMKESKEPNPKDETGRVVIVMQGDKNNNNVKVGETIIVTKVAREENNDAKPETYIKEGNFARENLKPVQEIDMKVEKQKGQVSIVENEEKTEPASYKKPVDELLGDVIVLQGDKENYSIVEDIGEPFLKENVNEQNIRPVKEIILKIAEVRRTGNAGTNEERMVPVIEEINEQKPIERDLNEHSEKPFGEIDLKVEEQSGDTTQDIAEEETEPAVEQIKEAKSKDVIRGFVSAMQSDEKMNDNAEYSEPIGVTKRDNEDNMGREKASNLTTNSGKSVGDTELEVGERGNDNADHIEEKTDPKEDIVKNKIPENSICIEEADKMVRGEESSKKRKTENNTLVIKEAPEAAVEKGNKSNAGKSFSTRLKKPIRKMRGTLRTNAKKNSNKYEVAKEPGTEINNCLIPKVVKQVEEVEEILTRNIGSKDVDTIVEGEMPHEEAKQTAIEDRESVNNDQVHGLDDNDILKRTDDSVLSDTDEGLELRRIGEDIEISNVELTGLEREAVVDLVDGKCTADEDKSGSVMEITEGTLPLTSYTDEKSVPSVDRSSPKCASRNSAAMPSSKVKRVDKIEKKIGALRTIVGYSITPQATLLEELKALYIFTGVEPPISSEDSPNLDDMEDKLRFLMSIVGVK